jgi:hypothetical protein
VQRGVLLQRVGQPGVGVVQFLDDRAPGLARLSSPMKFPYQVNRPEIPMLITTSTQ